MMSANLPYMWHSNPLRYNHMHRDDLTQETHPPQPPPPKDWKYLTRAGLTARYSTVVTVRATENFLTQKWAEDIYSLLDIHRP